MNRIYIEHNPFTVETLFRINGQAASESLGIQAYRNQRLQLWVEKIFTELGQMFDGDNQFSVKFKGVESDFLDVEAAAKKARVDGMHIKLKWQPVKSAEVRLREVKALLKTLEKDARFAQHMESSGGEAKRKLEAAVDDNFDAYVVATMSSGKSTFINAMLGRDLLPAANEATTATIAQITDDKTTGDHFTGMCLGDNGDILEASDNVDLTTTERLEQ